MAKRKHQTSATSHGKRPRTMTAREAAGALKRTTDYLAEEYKLANVNAPSNFRALCVVIEKILAGDPPREGSMTTLDDSIELPSELQDDHKDYKGIVNMTTTADAERKELAEIYRSALLGQSDHEEPPSFVQGRDKAVQDGIDAPPPSEAAKHFVSEQDAHPMQIGRPYETTGPPITIFHDVFANFVNSINVKEPKLAAKDVATAWELITTASKGYDNEALRMQDMRPKIEKLLGNPVGGLSDAGFRPDGVVFHLAGDSDARVPILVIEAKNEVGTGGSDPSIQAAYSFRKLWATANESIRNASCSPSFVLSVAGPSLTIHGGIFTNGFIVQPLTEILGLANFPYPYRRARYIAQIMVALRTGLEELKTFYTNLRPTQAPPEARLAPAFRRYDDVTLTYITHDLLADRIGRAMFDAEARRDGEQEATLVKIKFTQQYCRTAHELLAERDFAPRLRYYGELADGWKVVVMDAGGPDLASEKLNPVPQRVLDDIKAALELLHENDLVFGDLRPPNILLCERATENGGKERGAMLVDFDWAGKDGQQEYPLMLNGKIKWPDGVEGGEVLRKTHDGAMLKLLRS